MVYPVSVVVPTLNEQDQIVRSIESAWSAGAVEVIVCDGGSRDRTVSLAESAGARVVPYERGRALQQNRGAEAARSEILLFLHADCRLDATCGEQVSNIMQSPTVVGGAFRQHIDAEGCGFRLLERGNAARVHWFSMCYGDQGIFVRRSVFQELGQFPVVSLMEDVLLMKKLRRRGRIVLLPGPIHVSSRRWQRHGLIAQTARNWSLLAANAVGVSPDLLAHFYPRHDSHET